MPPKRRHKIILRSTSYEATCVNTWDVPLCATELPDAQAQRHVISSLVPDPDDHEACYYEYAVCKHW